MKRIVRQGDRTTTGGSVITASSSSWDGGRPWALSGDRASCGTCKGTFPIAATANELFENGKAVVLDLDLVSCSRGKNRVIAGSGSTSFVDVGGKSNVKAGGETPPAAKSANPRPRFDEQMRFSSAEGIPMADIRYEVILDDLSSHVGFTDHNGLSERICTDRKSRIIRVRFYMDEHSGN